MTPGARISAAIDVVELVSGGMAAEKALTNWARGARYAGSKDRAAVRDLVFDVLRRWWSSAARGGGERGRQRLIGLLSEEEADLDALFSGEGHAPAPVGPDERPRTLEPETITALDCPEWMAPVLRRSLGDDFAPVLDRLRHRAPVFLRVNPRRGDVVAARDSLAREGIETRPHPLSPTALEVLSRPRAVSGSAAYRDGLVELQDAASQAVVDMLPLDGCARVLDYCAGGGGKTLAMAARHDAIFHAHDVAPARMRDLPDRAARAGVSVTVRAQAALETYDMVLVDVPCSGSGAWRRAPEGKLRLAPAGLERLCALQGQILDEAVAHVAEGGTLAYVTCSLCDVENEGRVRSFSERQPFSLVMSRRLTPLDGGDGFYCAILQRISAR